MNQVELIQKYFPELSKDQENKLVELEKVYKEWNARINVISRKDIDALYLKHVLHSLSIAKIHQLSPQHTVLDAGTGGGFPGIPLAILFPDVRFHLVDSIQKKIKVVNAVKDHLQLKNVTTDCQRVENINNKFNFVVSRAVTRMKPFHLWVKNKILPTPHHQKFSNGIIYLKGGDLNEELSELNVNYQLFALSGFFKEDFFESKYIVYIPFR